jgi:hypothetical protein
VLAGAVLVVEHDLGLAVAVRFEQLRDDISQAVLLSRVRQRYLDDVVADDVDQF